MKNRIIALLCAVMLALGALSPPAFASQSRTQYPISVEEYTENGTDAHRIKKVYQLSLSDDPAGIPTKPFVRDGVHYELLDLTMKNEVGVDTKDYSLLQAMETAGAKYRVPAKSEDFVGKGGAAERVSFSPQGGNERYGACDDAPEDAERRGIGTPATRAETLEKLVSSGFVERRKSKKVTNLIPTQIGQSLITVLPETLQSPLLTAEWEHRLSEVEHGTLDAADFMAGIAALVAELIATYQPVPGAEVLFPSGKESVGKCPRCGANVLESKKCFYCENKDCRFIFFKENAFFEKKRKQFTKAVAASLLKNGRVKLTGCWSEKAGKTYDATVELEDDGEKTNFKLVFDHG